MKKITILLSMLIFTAMLTAYAEDASETKPKAEAEKKPEARIENESQRPEIKFDAETYDIGDVTRDIASHSFEFRNTGSSELIIEKLVPS